LGTSKELGVCAVWIAAPTSRGRDVLACIVGGCPNEVIAHKLRTTSPTVDVHRADIVRHLKATHIVLVICAAIEAMWQRLYPEPAPVFPPLIACRFNEPAGRTSGPARFDPGPRRRQVPETPYHFLAPHLLAQYWFLGWIYLVRLDNLLRRTYPNAANLFRGFFALRTDGPAL